MKKIYTLGTAICLSLASFSAMAEVEYNLTSTSKSAMLQSETVMVTLTYDTEMNINDTFYEEYPVMSRGVTLYDANNQKLDAVIEGRTSDNSVVFSISPIDVLSKSTYTLKVDAGVAGDNTFYETDFADGKANVAEEIEFVPFRLKYPNVTFDMLPYEQNIYTALKSPAGGAAPETCVQVQLLFNYEQFGYSYSSPVMQQWGCAQVGVKVLDEQGNEVSGTSVITGTDPDNDEVYNFFIFGLEMKSSASYSLYIPDNVLGTYTWYANLCEAGNAMPEYTVKFVPSTLTEEPKDPDTPKIVYDVTCEYEVYKSQSYFVIYDENGNAVPDPETGKDAKELLDCIRIDTTWNVDWIDWPRGFSKSCLLLDGNGNPIETVRREFWASGSVNNMFIFELSGFDLHSSDTHTLVVPKGSLGDYEYGTTSKGESGRANDEIRISFVPSDYYGGVANVVADDNKVANVYNLQGVLVLSNATDADVKNLPAGLYIHGGRKVVVK